MYKLFETTDIKRGTIVKHIERIEDGAQIPFDPANTDAQQFAKWLQEGNVPEPAEEGGTVSPEWVAETITKLFPNG